MTVRVLIDRQLRLVHLQPRAVPRRARGRAGVGPQRRGDASTSCSARRYDRVVVSPGPCTPNEAGMSRRGDAPLPGGRDADRSASASATSRSAQAFGGKVVRHVPVHGKTTEIEHDGAGHLRGPAEPADRRRAITRSSSTRTCRTTSSRHRARRRRRDGDAPPRAAGARRAVPPRVGPDRRTASGCCENFLAATDRS